MEQDESSSSDRQEQEEVSLLNILIAKSLPGKAGVMVDVSVDGKQLKMEVDTGASVSIVSETTWKKSWRAFPCNSQLFD